MAESLSSSDVWNRTSYGRLPYLPPVNAPHESPRVSKMKPWTWWRKHFGEAWSLHQEYTYIFFFSTFSSISTHADPQYRALCRAHSPTHIRDRMLLAAANINHDDR